MITFEHVSKKYPDQAALQNMHFSLPKGKVIGIVGENGSGKSTSLKLMAGLVQPTKGVVRIDGEEAHRRMSKKVAFLSELDEYYPFFTVQQTVDYFASQHDDFDLQKAMDIVQFLKLDPGQKVKHLSKGNRGRLKMVLALARSCPYILMDEPLSGLDPMVRDSIIKSLISYVDVGKQTLIITTHEVQEIEPIMDQVLAIRSGKILAHKEVEEIREEQQISVVEWMKQVYAS